ncbi:hypothetical protein BKA83DRAFT_4185550 [Pisolithus microcarpus]|nr:hypothetical protein BKA83DRAFT_4185550 [Pisolithus microcarpus]
MLQGAHHGLRTSSLPSHASLQLSPYRSITSAAVGRVPSKRQSLLFHRPLPESKHNDTYKRSSKSVPKRSPLASSHSQEFSSAQRNRPPLPGICVDPANFTQIRSSYVQTATAKDSRRPSTSTLEGRLPVRDAPPIIPGRVSSQTSRAAASVDVQQVSPDEVNTSSDSGGKVNAIRDPAYVGAPKGSTSKGDTRAPTKLLEPYDLALELQRMCGQGDMDGAVRRLKSTPRDAQNTSVWNTMISLCTNAGRYKRAYEVFTDMKRRGFSPNVATFSTILKGLSQIDDWSKHSKQLANAHTLYGYYMDHVRSIKYHEPDNTKELNTVPLVFYLSILGEVGDRQKIFDVFFAMDAEGLFAPDKYLFCSMFDAITKCQERQSDSSDAVPVSNTAKSDAKYVWLQVEKAVQKQRGFELDPRVIGAAIRALTRGRPSDQTLALDIATKHLGFAMLGERATLRLSRSITPWTLDVTLTLCNTMQKYRLCVIERLDLDKPHERQIIDRGHIHKLLRAHSALARRGSPGRISAGSRSLTMVLRKRCRISASKVTSRPPNLPPLLSPDLETMSFIMRTALATKSVIHYKHAMRLAECVDLGAMLQNPKADAFYRARVAVPLVRIINHLKGEVPTEKHLGWNCLLHVAAKSAANEHRRPLGRTWSFEGENGALLDTRDGDPDTQDIQLS